MNKSEKQQGAVGFNECAAIRLQMKIYVMPMKWGNEEGYFFLFRYNRINKTGEK